MQEEVRSNLLKRLAAHRVKIEALEHRLRVEQLERDRHIIEALKLKVSEREVTAHAGISRGWIYKLRQRIPSEDQ